MAYAVAGVTYPLSVSSGFYYVFVDAVNVKIKVIILYETSDEILTACLEGLCITLYYTVSASALSLVFGKLQPVSNFSRRNKGRVIPLPRV